MAKLVHTYPLLIVERHLDTFGHVNNATYLQLFEEARWDWIHGNGYGLDEIRRSQQGPTIVEINIRFKRELMNRMPIVIETYVDRYDSKVGQITQRMLDAQGRLCCEARMAVGLFDLKERRLIEPTPKWLAALGISEAERFSERERGHEGPAGAGPGGKNSADEA